MEHIINIERVRNSGRPIGKVVDDKLSAFLTEAETLLVKPIIGEELFWHLTNRDASTFDKTFDKTFHNSLLLSTSQYNTLIDGGTYTTPKGKMVCFNGLAAAISYYVYAKIVLCGDVESTRYGMVVKDDEYSTRLSQKERADIYHDALDVAHAYMADCGRYIASINIRIKSCAPHAKQRITGARVRKIG